MDLNQILNEVGPLFEKNAPTLDKENTFAEENFKTLKEKGAYKALIPKELGGGGVSYSDLCYFLKDLAKFCPSTALTLSMHQHLIAVLTFKYLNGDEGAKNTLTMVAEKDLVLLSTGGGDFLSSNGSATKVDGGFKINCRKSFCSGSPIANVAVMSCAYDDGQNEHVLHFSAPMNSDGIEIVNDWDAMGMKGTGSNSVDFKDVFIPDEKIALKRARGEWHPVWDVVSTLAFPIFIAPYAGVAEAINEKTIELIAGRESKTTHTAASLGEMNNHYKITQMALENLIENAKNLDIKPDSKSASRALQSKSLITKYGRECAQSAMEALGGYSYYKKVGIERLYRDLLAGEFHPMQAGKQKELLGKFLMGGTLGD
ncbi:MAG: acyl-CoA/acyl-ACP dehydrogenase [Bacteriovoracaceae bacterium]|nr:acyl-CoA/acyl-ACP dehydrogenase [Bacteriovoracaceae bacterium]